MVVIECSRHVTEEINELCPHHILLHIVPLAAYEYTKCSIMLYIFPRKRGGINYLGAIYVVLSVYV